MEHLNEETPLDKEDSVPRVSPPEEHQVGAALDLKLRRTDSETSLHISTDCECCQKSLGFCGL